MATPTLDASHVTHYDEDSTSENSTMHNTTIENSTTYNTTRRIVRTQNRRLDGVSLQQGWLSVNGNMTAYRLQSGTSCTGYQFVNGSSSRCVFSCTSACTIYHPAICPTCVSRSLSTPAAYAYDQLHAAISSSQPQEQSATALVASPLQDQLRGTRHHSAMTNCLSLHFAVYTRLNFLPEHTTLL